MIPADAVAAFNRLASRYDAWHETPLGTFADAQEKEAVFALAGVQPGEQALDVGCGTGNYTLGLVRGGARAVGIDAAPAMLAVAVSKTAEAGGAVRFAQADAHTLPFPAQAFDLVVSVTTLEFLASPQIAVVEMMRALRPGGRLVLGTLNAWSTWGWSYRRQKGTVYQSARFFSPPTLLALLQPFGPVVWRSCLFIPPWSSTPSQRMTAMLEYLGAGLLKPFGAFLVARVKKSELTTIGMEETR